MGRRDFIRITLLAALAPLAAQAVRRWSAAASAGTPMLRPAARDVSTIRCARCGTTGHTALDTNCPLIAQPAAAIQTAARSHATANTAGGSWT